MTDDITTRFDGVLERTADGGVIRFERHLAYGVGDVWNAITLPDVQEAIDNCYLVGLQTSLDRLTPALAGRPAPWDWDTFGADRDHYARLGLAAPVGAS